VLLCQGERMKAVSLPLPLTRSVNSGLDLHGTQVRAVRVVYVLGARAAAEVC